MCVPATEFLQRTITLRSTLIFLKTYFTECQIRDIFKCKKYNSFLQLLQNLNLHLSNENWLFLLEKVFFLKYKTIFIRENIICSLIFLYQLGMKIKVSHYLHPNGYPVAISTIRTGEQTSVLPAFAYYSENSSSFSSHELVEGDKCNLFLHADHSQSSIPQRLLHCFLDVNK